LAYGKLPKKWVFRPPAQPGIIWPRFLEITKHPSSGCDNKKEVFTWKPHIKITRRFLVSYFSVACGEDLYQVSFNNTSFGWRLDKIIT